MTIVYRSIQRLGSRHAIKRICEVLEISKSAYYSWLNGDSYQLSEEKDKIKHQVKAIFDRHLRRYGSRRIREELKDEGFKVGIYQVRSLMRLQNLVAIQPKSFVPKTTNSQGTMNRNSNLLLNEKNLPQGPNEVIVGDITYLPCKKKGDKKWLYLAIWMDLFLRKIVGWQVGERMDESLVIQPMKRLIKERNPPKDLIVHSDGGGQYSSSNFRKILTSEQFRQSMTRKENHYDNAFIESLFSRLKAELGGIVFSDLEDARLKIFEYIEGYYNTIRKHSSLGYLSPNQYEAKYWSDKEKDEK